ncbi:hypothetical protein DVK02_14820 [Halobellus sp. Atlit-31R]|nr:hypothetical protein DVK02_14820 [Halobellus sp. Atlit-31R]
MSRRRLKVDDEADRWRFRCPAGHRNWEATNNHFFCQSCSRSQDPDHDPVFHELRDLQTGELIDRDELVLDGYEDTLRHLGRTADD